MYCNNCKSSQKHILRPLLNISSLQDTHILTVRDKRKQEINADKNLQASFQLKVISKISLVWEADFPLLKYPWYLTMARLLSTSLVIRLTLASMTYRIKSYIRIMFREQKVLEYAEDATCSKEY